MVRCLPEYYRYIEYSTTSTSVFVGILLVYLIVFRTPPELAKYSRVLLCPAIVDMLFSVVSNGCGLHLEVHGDIFTGLLNGFFETQSSDVVLLLCCISFSFVYLTVFIAAIPFVYRYLLICRQYQMSNKSFAALVFVQTTSASLVGIYVYFVHGNDSNRLTAEMSGLCPGREHFLVSDDVLMSPKVLGLFLCVGLAISTNYCVIVVCSYKTLRALKHIGSQSATFTAINRQLNYIFALQAATPLLFLVGPLLIAYLAIVVGSKSAVGTFFIRNVMTMLSVVPFVNPIFTLVLIKPYRKWLLDRLKCVDLKGTSSVAVVARTSTHAC